MDRITRLEPNEVFVFGSNLAGIHGAGAARDARVLFDAQWGVGFGPTMKTYAIPTKDENIETLPLERIEIYISLFIAYAMDCPDLKFLVTPIGCGLAGYSPDQIAPMFRDAPPNVILPEEFLVVLRRFGNPS